MSVDRVELTEWFRLIWQDTPGAVKFATQSENLEWKNLMFAWPDAAERVVDWVIAQNGTGNEVFYSPAMYYDRSSGKSDNVKGSHVLWADFDGNAPADWSEAHLSPLSPSLRVQSSSPGHEHCYWLLDQFIDKPTLEDKNRALAYELHADTSGWDAGQVLRPPTTTNHKYSKPEIFETFPVEIISQSSAIFNPAFIEAPKNFVQVVKDSINFDNLPDLSRILASHNFPDAFSEVFFKTKEDLPDKKRSDTLLVVGYYGAEAGLSDDEVYVLVENADSRWEKYTLRTPENRRFRIVDIVERARQKYPSGGSNLVERFNAKAQDQTNTQIVYKMREFMEIRTVFTWDFTGLLTRNGSGILGGEPGVGKTQILNQLALANSAGMNFLAWSNPGLPRRTLYLGLEMPTVGLQKFFRATEENRTEEQNRLVEENLLIAPLNTPVPLDTEPGRKFLIDLAEKYQPATILVDSISKAVFKNLSDEDVAKRFNDFIQEFRERFQCSVVFVAHTKKRQQDRKASQMDPLNDLFGSRFLSADLDFLLGFGKTSIPGEIYVKNAKNRYEVEYPDFIMRRNSDLSFEIVDILDGEKGADLLASFARGQGFGRGSGPQPPSADFGQWG